MKNKNGLLFKKIKSHPIRIDSIENIDIISDYIQNNSYVVAFMDNEVIFGKYKDQKFEFPKNQNIELKYVNRMRIFNEKEELHIWRSKSEYRGRYRNDEDGESTDIVEADQVLSGTRTVQENGNTVLTEEMGTRFVLPGKWQADDKKQRVAIKTRHYIDYFNGYQASYCDSRFVKFVQLPIKGGKKWKNVK